jgi:hypothetical protein
MEKAKSFYKNEKGFMFCSTCHDPVVWKQTKAGKWYLAVAEIIRVNVSSRNVEKYEEKVVSQTKAGHYGVCERIAKMRKEIEQEKLGK